MAKTVKVLADAPCIRCHKKIKRGNKAICEQHGLTSLYYHPHCWKRGYVWHHGRYVKKSSLEKK